MDNYQNIRELLRKRSIKHRTGGRFGHFDASRHDDACEIYVNHWLSDCLTNDEQRLISLDVRARLKASSVNIFIGQTVCDIAFLINIGRPVAAKGIRTTFRTFRFDEFNLNRS